MTIYYIAELSNKNSYTEANKIEATNLTQAKRIASRNRCFYGTVLEIGYSIDDNNFIREPICQKINGRWINYDNC